MNEETWERKKRVIYTPQVSVPDSKESCERWGFKSLTDFHDGCVRISAWWVCLQIFLQRNKNWYQPKQSLYVICKCCLALDISFYKLKRLQWRKNSNMRKDPHAHTTDPQAHTCTCTHARTHAHTHTHACTHACTHTHTHTHAYNHTTPQTTHIHTSMHTHTNIHMHACTYTHTCTHTHAHRVRRTWHWPKLRPAPAPSPPCWSPCPPTGTGTPSSPAASHPLGPDPPVQHKTHTTLHCFFVHTSHPSAQNTHNIALLLRPHIPPFSTKHTRHCTASSSTHPTLQHKTHTSLHCFFVHTSHPSAQNTHVIALLLRPHIPPFSTKHMCHCTAASYPRPTVQHKTHNACEKQYWECHLCLLSLLPYTLCTTKPILTSSTLCIQAWRPLWTKSPKVTHLNKVMQLLRLDAARSVGDLEEARGVAASILPTKGQHVRHDEQVWGTNNWYFRLKLIFLSQTDISVSWTTESVRQFCTLLVSVHVHNCFFLLLLYAFLFCGAGVGKRGRGQKEREERECMCVCACMCVHMCMCAGMHACACTYMHVCLCISCVCMFLKKHIQCEKLWQQEKITAFKHTCKRFSEAYSSLPPRTFQKSSFSCPSNTMVTVLLNKEHNIYMTDQSPDLFMGFNAKMKEKEKNADKFLTYVLFICMSLLKVFVFLSQAE